jgi:hypothetical protein
MEIRAAGTIETRRAPADAFTGTVGHDPIIDAPAPAPGTCRARQL